MKKIIITFLLMAMVPLSMLGQGQGKRTVVTVFIPQTDEVMHRIYFLVGDKRYETAGNQGYFKFVTSISEPARLLIEIDDRRIIAPYYNTMFIEPADSIEFKIMDLKALGFENINVSGIGSKMINIHKEIFLKASEYSKANFDDFKADSIEWRIAFNLNLLKLKLNILSRNRQKLSGDMYNILRAHYTIGGLALVSEITAKKIAAGRIDLIPLANEMISDSLMAPLLKVQGAMVVEGYFSLYVYTAALVKNAERSEGKIDSSFFYRKKLNQYYGLIAEYIVHNPNRDYLLSGFIEKYVKLVGFNPELEQCVNRFLADTDHSSPYYDRVKNLLLAENDKRQKFLLPEFTLTDISGKDVSTKKFQGKVIVLDFWFTGCNGCRDIKPYFEQVEQQFSKREDIVFLSISIDRNREEWVKKGIGKYSSADAIQLFTGGLADDHPIIKYLNFNSYPAIFMIDKMGNVVLSKINFPDIRTAEGSAKFVSLIKKELSSNQ